MPLFDVKCKFCGFTEERILKLDQAVPACRACGGETSKLKPSQFAFAFGSAGGCYKQSLSPPSRTAKVKT